MIPEFRVPLIETVAPGTRVVEVVEVVVVTVAVVVVVSVEVEEPQPTKAAPRIKRPKPHTNTLFITHLLLKLLATRI
jgi:hypothetical protein